MKKTGLKRIVIFSVDFNPIDINDILNMQKYLMIRTWYKIMFGLIKKIFIGLLTNIYSFKARAFKKMFDSTYLY